MPHHSSGSWNIPELFGDIDAHRAMLIFRYKNSQLPWDEIISWLRSKKNDFKSNPPIWMSMSWLDILPEKVKDEVWSEPNEYKVFIQNIKRNG